MTTKVDSRTEAQAVTGLILLFIAWILGLAFGYILYNGIMAFTIGTIFAVILYFVIAAFEPVFGLVGKIEKRI